MMASAQVVETSVNTTNSPSQDYTTNPDDHSNHNIVVWMEKSHMNCAKSNSVLEIVNDGLAKTLVRALRSLIWD